MILYLQHLFHNDGSVLIAYTLTRTHFRYHSFWGDSPDFPSLKSSFQYDTWSITPIIALMNLCCYCLFILMLPSLNVLMTSSYIAVCPKHSRAPAMCPILISVSHNWYCHLPLGLLCLVLAQRANKASSTCSTDSQLENTHIFCGECLFWHVGIFCCFGSHDVLCSSMHWDEMRGTWISF